LRVIKKSRIDGKKTKPKKQYQPLDQVREITEATLKKWPLFPKRNNNQGMDYAD
jgi:hypothetical protein